MKSITDYFVTYPESGIVCLTINTVDRWTNFYQNNDHHYEIWYRVGSEGHKEDLFIPEDELIIKEGYEYVPAVHQNKEQICFYFIPFRLINDKFKLSNQ